MAKLFSGTDEQLLAQGYEKGTPCQREIVSLFFESDEAVLPAEFVRNTLLSRGHVLTTINRALNQLQKCHVLEKVPTRSFRLLNQKLPWIKKNNSRPGISRNRFGSEDAAKYVREFLIDRLDLIFENPNAYLVKVLQAVEWAGQMAQAVLAGDRAKMERAVEQYRERWHESQANTFLRPLTVARLAEGLQIGLFLEEFADDEEVKQEIEKQIAIARSIREQGIAETILKNEAIVLENQKRIANGEEPIPLQEVDKKFLNEKYVANGLVPRGGGERVGVDRLKAFLRTIGVDIPDEEIQ